MRIGFDGTPLQSTRSGVGIYSEQLLRHLARLYPQWEYLLYTNKPYIQNGIPGMTPFAGYFQYSRWLWMQFKLPQVIAHSGAEICHFMNNSAPLGCTVPYTMTIHDASLFLLSQYHPCSRLLALRVLLPWVARRAEAVITVSHASYQELVQVLRLPPQKVHVVYSAVSAEFRPLNDAAARLRLQKRYRLPPKFILYVGTIEPRKNIQRLIAAYAQAQRYHPDCHLVLVGPNGWKVNGELAKQVARLALADKVHYLGFVPRADLPGIYSLATLFAFPSLHEGFGLPLLEAMACGVPVLTSNRSAMREISGSAAYQVDPDASDAIAAGLIELLDAPALRARYIRQGFQRVQQFSWAQTAQETAAIYKTILAGAQ